METFKKIIDNLCTISLIAFVLILLDNWVFEWGWAALIPFKVKLTLVLPYVVAIFFH